MKIKISCVIVDDEASGRIVLKELLNKFHPEIQVIGEADSAENGFKEISALKPDLVFLDIQMPGGNGFDLLKKFNNIAFKIIFVTSYQQYAISAFKFNALDYLLKPIDIEELNNSIQKVKQAITKEENLQPMVLNLLNNMDTVSSEKKIAVHHQDKVKFLMLTEVICLEAESNYTHIYSSDNQRYTPARVLKDFEEYLAELPNFIRINKSVIVNLDYLSEYSKGEPCFLYLKNGKEYEIGRRKKAELMERLKNKKQS